MPLYRPHRLTQKLKPLAVLACLAFGVLRLARAADRKAPPVKPATQYATFDTHPAEHVSIAAEPCDEPKNCSFFRLEYVQHGFIPVRVTITNDRDTSIALDDARFQFISANNDKIPAATDEEINRRLFSTKSALGTKIPLIPITIHHAPVDKKITEDNNDFGFDGTTVKPHATLAGYLFYDIRSLDDPALKHAELYIKMIHSTDPKEEGRTQELFAFTIPFDKWLAANPAAPSNTSRR